jgi:hypothetical protein
MKRREKRKKNMPNTMERKIIKLLLKHRKDEKKI